MRRTRDEAFSRVRCCAKASTRIAARVHAAFTRSTGIATRRRSATHTHAAGRRHTAGARNTARSGDIRTSSDATYATYATYATRATVTPNLAVFGGGAIWVLLRAERSALVL